jgi:Dolichyl-phosphate-mannose-protein mannosyltransferase
VDTINSLRSALDLETVESPIAGEFLIHERAKTLTRATSGHWRSWLVGSAFLLLAGIGVARIVLTYPIFSQTYDEPAHLATGMEWLERGTYTFEPLHPPLARVAVALAPYLSGLRLTGEKDMWVEGDEILLAHNRYVRNLSLARLGVLPFFLLATFVIWHWGRVRYGDAPALVATLLFTTSPAVLAHAGLATTDIALTATFAAALMVFINWLERPSYLRSAVLGVAVGLAVLSKFSALLFLPACGIAVLAWRWLLERGRQESIVANDSFRRGRGLAVAVMAMILVVWAGYRFSIGPVTPAGLTLHPRIDHLLGTSGTFHNWAYSAAEFRWTPAPAFFRGLAALRDMQANGQKGYLLGQIRLTGWWYFFPVALVVKTPLPFLILIFVGIFYLGKAGWLERNWILVAPVAAALALLLVCMPSHINIGLRHILPIYPFLALIGGVGACRLWSGARPKYVRPAVVLILLAWQLTSSIRAHPDYLAYFNELAGQHPERILIDSDLDWGQDLFRLSAALRQRHVEEVSIAYEGSPDLDLHQFGLPSFHILIPHEPTDGWIAISLKSLKTGGFGFPNDSFWWLESYKPVCLVGRSIRLYDVPRSARVETEQRVSNVR